jgi:ABC-2 type transport system ATP-binding protein
MPCGSLVSPMRKTIVAAALLALLPLSGFGVPVAADHGPSEKTFGSVPSVGGHQVPITVYRPLDASEANPVPVLLHSHGWSGSRAKQDGAFHDFVAAGFGVVSIDMRGHGDARFTSEARVHHMDHEIADVRAVIDHVATLPWVRLDAPGDPRVGAIGGSYGGAYQLLAAATDERLDALAPEITWHDLVQSLAPNGAPKSAWVDVLYASGNLLVRVHPTIHEGFAYVQATNTIPDGSVPGTTDLKTQFTHSSPRSYADGITIPTMLMQGMPDTLFNFDQAAANYRQIRAAGGDARLMTHLGGHVLNTQGTLSAVPAPTPIGLQPPAGGTPCGKYEELAVDFFRLQLRRDPGPPGARVCLALDDGTTVTGPDYPLPGTQRRAHALAGSAIFAQGAPNPGASFTVFTADKPAVIAGAPRLGGQVTVAGPDAILYWSLVVDAAKGGSRVLGAQVTPLRLAGTPLGTQTFELDLFGVAARLEAGDTLRLVASTHDPQYAHNAQRLPGAVTVVNLAVTVPVLAGNAHAGK